MEHLELLLGWQQIFHHIILGEIIDAVFALAENPAITIEELMEIIPGPDFPTGGIIFGRSGIRRAYETGRGSITIRGKVEIEEKSNGKETILVKNYLIK